MPSATTYVQATGMPVEWEWRDAAQTVMFFEGDQAWRKRGAGHLTDQNASRTVAPVFFSVLGKWIHDAWYAAVVGTWFAWCWCTWAIARLVGRSSWLGATTRGAAGAATASVVLAATASGFLGFVGDIDAHVFGYAAVALGLGLVLEWVFRHGEDRGVAGSHPSLIGMALFILDGTLQLGVPLIAFAVGVAIWRGFTATPVQRRGEAQKLGHALVIFIAMALMWSLISRVGSDGVFDVHNEAVARAREALSRPLALISTFPFKALGVLHIALALFRWWLVVAACVGWVVASVETKMWTLGWIGLVVVATVLTRYTASTVYVMFPAIYVLAAVCAGFVADSVARVVPRLAVSRLGSAVVVAFGAGIVSVVPALTQLAFLWGDYTMPAVWWPGP